MNFMNLMFVSKITRTLKVKNTVADLRSRIKITDISERQPLAFNYMVATYQTILNFFECMSMCIIGTVY